jgi:dTDP-4-amino-4,6-dideoxygalactose transaminase
MSESPIRLALPYTDDDEINEVAAVLESGYLTQGPKVQELEEAVARVAGTRYAFATTSATTALHLSLAALGIRRGDEVIVPDFTFPATANVVVQLGARPVLVDVDPRTYAMDAEQLERHISARTRAIMPVHPFGLSADMDGLLAVSDRHGIPIVEDAACALATTYRGVPVGGFGRAGCFSFHPRKSITTGEGGMIVTNDADLADRISVLRNHGGRRSSGRFRFEDAGFNYRLSDILAAVGVAQMRKLDWIIARRREIAALYDAALEDVSGVTSPWQPSWGGHVYQSYVTRVDSTIDRDAVIRGLAERGIETTLGTYALHSEPYFVRALGHAPGDLTNSWDAYRTTLTLPLFPQMSEAMVERVVHEVAEVLAGPAQRSTRASRANA